ncbi:MAG: hypothetical protein JW929_06735 [Anaerolineales bacterium]|nr:hypothetical protein [Anaerolineales bacterium]
MPGTFLAFWIFGRLTGYSVLGVRILDYLLLAAIIFLGWLGMRKQSGWAGFLGGVAWGLAYLSLGPTAMLQREYLMMIPLLCAFAAYANIPPQRNAWRFLLTGLFMGISTTFKPQAFIGLLPIMIVEWFSYSGNPIPSTAKKPAVFFNRIAAWLLIGFLTPWMLIVTYLGFHGALQPFLDMTINYLPLFAQLNKYHQAVSGIRRVYSIILDYVQLGGYGIWAAPALWGIYQLQQSPDASPDRKRHGVFLFWSIVAFSIYPAFSGQFFPQHWLPFLFLLLQAAFLSLTDSVITRRTPFRLAPAALIAIASLSLVRPDTLDNLWLLTVKHELPAANNPKEGRVDEIASYLETHLQPGDTVQPVDWVGGAVHAMLIARVRIATPFIYDEYFYHNVNDPYIQRLRERFMASLESAMPRFIVEVYDDGPFAEPTGPGTSREFPEFRAFLAEHYTVVKEGPGYRIYELRKEGSTV